MRIMCVAGARPNFMKIKPVLDALEAQGVDIFLVHTEQHYDDTMSRVFFDELGIRHPDASLGVGAGTHAEQTARVMLGIEPVMDEWLPDVVVVVGDVNSTVAAAFVAAKKGVEVAHVEAGLRSRDWSMPEEVNRVVTDRLSQILLAPSPDAVENLRAEGHDASNIVLVGNVMIDTLLANVERARERPVLERLGLEPGAYGLLTMHRPANVDDPVVLGRLLGVVSELSAQLRIVFPAHPRVAARLDVAGLPPALSVVAPLGYLDFVALEADARLVLTDSGGVQEETTALGVPCLTLRDNTERPITVDEGTNVIVGRDPAVIRSTFARTLTDPPVARRPALWDGHAGERIVEALLAR